jgi:hypothetical protein
MDKMPRLDIDIDDLPPKVVRKMLRQALSRREQEDDEKEKDVEKSDKDRDDLSRLHEEGNGKAPELPVLKDDLPDYEDDDKEEEEKPKKKGKVKNG